MPMEIVGTEYQFTAILNDDLTSVAANLKIMRAFMDDCPDGTTDEVEDAYRQICISLDIPLKEI